MGKFLVLVVLAVVVVWWLRAAQRRNAAFRRPPPPTEQRIVRCEHCAVHGPENEMIVADGHVFCCEKHRDEFSRRQTPQ